MAKKQQQELPFTLEGNTAPRTQIRTVTKNQDGLYKIDLSIIRIRPQFNARRKPEGMSEEMWEHTLMIPQLADAIFASNGPAEPLLGDIYKEDGCFYLTNGERRFRALRHLAAANRLNYPNETPVTEVQVLLNPQKTTDLDRKRKVISTQDNLKLKPMERAYYYLSFKVEDKMTHEGIAEFLQVSRQTVDNYILATELPLDIQVKIDSDEVKLTVALAEYREAHKKPKKGGVMVDLESGEILTEAQERKMEEEAKAKDKVRGDEEEFEQQDNSVPGVSSKGGPKEEGSGAHVIGKDAIYMDGQKLALWKQFVHRYEVVKDIVMAVKKEGWEEEVAKRLKDEYNLTVK